MMRPRIRDIRRLTIVILASWAVPGNARIVNIEWDGGGRFERRIEVAPGRLAEVCGKLAKGSAVRWSFEATGPLDFNVHFHEGGSVRYPARQDGASRLSGVLRADTEQDYCWMWTNKSSTELSLEITLTK